MRKVPANLPSRRRTATYHFERALMAKPCKADWIDFLRAIADFLEDYEKFRKEQEKSRKGQVEQPQPTLSDQEFLRQVGIADANLGER